jgi:multiple sugar transport system substrate-binding protein
MRAGRKSFSRKEFLGLGAAGAASLALSGCGGGQQSGQTEGTLTIWTFFDQVEDMGKQFEKRNKGLKVNVKVFPGDAYETKLRTAIQSRQNPPDVFDLERGYLGAYLDAPFVENLSEMGADDLVEDYVPYVAELAKDRDGNIRGVSDHSSPGGFWVRADVAEEYLGTKDPDEISEMVESWEKVISLGERVAEESGGEIHLLPHYGDVQAVEQYHKETWVRDGALYIDPSWNELLDTVREVRAKNVDAKLEPFSPGWGDALNSGTVVMTALPSWAGFLIDQEKTAGKWRLAVPPKGFYQGGTYRAIYTESPNKELGYEFIKFIASEEWQDYNLDKTLNMPANQSVYKENMDSFKPELFGGQKVLDVYYETAMDVPGQPADKYSEEIMVLFREARDEMIDRDLTNEETIAEFKQQVSNNFPDVEVS